VLGARHSPRLESPGETLAIEADKLVGSDAMVEWSRSEAGLEITAAPAPDELAVVYKVEVRK
jgi:hypothetical protein